METPIMSIPSDILDKAVMPALAYLPAKMNTPAALIMLIAIGLQESRLIHRKQIGGPAHGLWQFERGGGVRGVINFGGETSRLAKAVCEAEGVRFTADDVYQALPQNDVLAAAFARLLLWTDPKPLPNAQEVDKGWDLYMRTWRPGKPHPETWCALYTQAVVTVGGLE